MARVFITGSSEGLGMMAAQLLVEERHEVVLHARSETRAQDARGSCPQAHSVIVGDLSNLAAMRSVAEQANALGRFDAVIHNVGIGYREPRRVETLDGLSQLWAVNVLAPYVLTSLMERPDRLVYLSSGLHRSGSASLEDLQWTDRRWQATQAYSDTKLHDVWLAFGIARRWPGVLSNALEPGWVSTRMGGAGATDDLSQGHLTQVWLATSSDRQAFASGAYFYHKEAAKLHPAARQADLQDQMMEYCWNVSGVSLAS